MTRGLWLPIGVAPSKVISIMRSAVARRNTPPLNVRFLASWVSRSSTSVVRVAVACRGLLQLLLPQLAPLVGLSLGLLRPLRLRRQQPSPRQLRLWLRDHLLFLRVSRQRLRRISLATRVQRRVFGGMGMRTGLTLNLMGLFPTIPILSTLHACKFCWSLLAHLWIRASRRMTSFSLQILCRRCSRPSPLKILAWLFVWSWTILVLRTIWFLIARHSSLTSLFATSMFGWVTTLMLPSWGGVLCPKRKA
jgi:hypothetical protein